MEQKNLLFSKKALNKLIGPLVMEQILAVAVGMIDVIMIASVGEAAVSGVSLVDNISILLIGLFSALATGGAVVAGHFLGQNDEENACRAANQIVLFVIVSSVGIMILYLLGRNFILTVVFGKIEEDVMRAASTYLIITGLSIPGIALYNGCAALFRAMGNSKITMWISLVMNVLNAAGNAVLIYLVHIGVAGAAIATTFSRYVAAVTIMILLFNKNNTIHLDRHFEFRFHRAMIRKILYIGIPTGLENSIFQLGKILILSLVSVCGTYAIAANAVAGTIGVLNVIPGNAMSLALLSVVSVCIGADNFEQARYYTKKLIIKVHIFTGIISAMIILFAPFIVKIYHLSEQTASATETLIRMHAVCAMLFWPESFVLPNTLRASNDVRFTMGISIFSMWVFRIGASYLFVNVFDMNIVGVWMAMFIDWLFRAAVFVTRYIRGRWQSKYTA
ncbi:MAG TPA: MATE family efflux transporter [Lachnospiraceae bacterium]|nr:MATE family efflux transporter [Lachnospiraceae bacterium]